MPGIVATGSHRTADTATAVTVGPDSAVHAVGRTPG